ncbi:MAG: discoidin domain-containing protein [Phycisphaerae bacterium]
MGPTTYRGWILPAMLAVLAGGCGDSFTQGREPGGSRVTRPNTWKLSGDLSNLPNAVDNSFDTVATSGKSYLGDAVTVDLGAPCLLNLVVMTHGTTHQDGHPRRVALDVSLDGDKFKKVSEVSGTRRVTAILIVTPTLARYIRLRAVEEGSEPWAIAELVVQ